MDMMNRILYFFRNMKLKIKLLLIYFLASGISIILLFIVLRTVIGPQFFRHEQSLLENSLYQGVSQLESQLSNAINLCDVIYNNNDMLRACNMDYKNNYFKMYTAYQNDILPDFYIYKCLLPNASNIKIYTSCGLIPYMDSVDDISRLKEIPWFDEQIVSHSLQWGIIDSGDSPKLACIRKLPQNTSYPFKNFLYYETDYESSFASLTAISRESYGIIVAGADNAPLFRYHSFQNGDMPIEPEELLEDYAGVREAFSKQYIFFSAPVESVGWTVYYYSPTHEIRATVEKAILSAFFIITFSLTLLFLLTFFIINTILSPLAQLTGAIEKISLENISCRELQIMPDRKDEIGVLIQTFNTMLERIHTLIDEAYVQKLNVKEYQLKALRAQINPHFLYNTLSLINARAIIAEQEDISETVQLLTLFYRTSLNHGHDLTRIRNELDNIRAYLSIQLILTDHAFEVTYELDETLLDITIPCLILQPLVENAIEHGLRNSRKPEKKLCISLYEEDCCCYISIWDNGLGISGERMKELFSCETDHIGVKNVYERLRLSYGEGNGLSIESLPGVETRAVIRIPR